MEPKARPERALTSFVAVAGSLVGFYWPCASLSLLASLAEHCPSPAGRPLVTTLGLSVDKKKTGYSYCLLSSCYIVGKQ